MAAAALRVWFVHPDLGLGGAEMLVVNAALALQRRGRAVRIVTAHQDPERCFSGTKAGGPLGACVEVRGDWLPRTVLGRLHVACAALRMAWASLSVAARSALGRGPDVLVVDQVAHVVPLLRWLTGLPVVFYCHFPDKLLCVDRSSLLKRAYRAPPFDRWEEASTGAADAVVVNSRFTGGIFRESFESLSATPLRVLYPAIDLSQFDRELAAPATAAAAEGLPAALRQLLARPQGPRSGPVLLLSINRFERMKNLELAVEAFAALRAMLDGEAEPDVGEIAGPGEPRGSAVLCGGAAGPNIPTHEGPSGFARRGGGSVVLRVARARAQQMVPLRARMSCVS